MTERIEVSLKETDPSLKKIERFFKLANPKSNIKEVAVISTKMLGLLPVLNSQNRVEFNKINYEGNNLAQINGWSEKVDQCLTGLGFGKSRNDIERLAAYKFFGGSNVRARTPLAPLEKLELLWNLWDIYHQYSEDSESFTKLKQTFKKYVNQIKDNSAQSLVDKC